MNLWTGIAMLVVAAVLCVIGRPNSAGEHPKFLRFNAALVLYPPIILVFLGLGAAAVISSLLTK
ncbi:hypothetical protein [Bradyrhizobium sp. AUGA SZCCT0283]|jgi:hypothetical protein|uniref:hypothetical protein n=1 Tax=Bradyrhizobium sp. AUGA SZCCT0283 TaxID=2807671 RepID=UPI001BA52898|nr:hypothetical protein [Bradyrhizobium sp. AUGA SZCCT0283]MBR1279589.1 hypothetical protein [Bradyrhizobium sp. AUGA SZCCT0283]